jgi:hypothetical protein
MLLTFLSRLMSSLLTTLLFVTIVGATANQTILNRDYVEQKLESQQAYDRLSTALSQKISEDSNDPSIPQDAVASQLKTVLTADVLRDKIDTTIKQLEAYYKGDGPVPTLDISDLVQKAQAEGLPIDAEKFDKPVKLTALETTKPISDSAQIISIGVIVLAALLLLGVLAIAIRRRDYRPLANIVFSLGLMLTITGAALLLVPNVFSRMYKFDASTNPFGSLFHDLAVIAIHDFGLRLLIPGIVALLLGILAKLLIRSHRRKGQEGKGRLNYARADTPEPVDSLGNHVSIEDAPTTPSTQKTADTPGAPPAPAEVKKQRKIQL